MAAELIANSYDPNRPNFEPYGLTCVDWSPSTMDRPDYHNEIELNFVKTGSLSYLFGGKRKAVEVGKLCVFWAAIPHQVIDFSENTTYFVATIPLQSFLQWNLPEKIVHPLLQGRFLSESDCEKSSSDQRLFTQWTEDLQTHSTELQRPVLSEMQARLLRLGVDLPDFSPNESDLRSRAPFPTVSENGLHPNYAMNLFQKSFGTTLLNYVTQHRVSHAQRLLTTTDLIITEIALQSGFQSISRFNEAFSRMCGCSPREYRKSFWLEDYSKK